MTTEQEKALKVCEKLVNCMTDHTLSAEDIMILIQGILSNDCGGCNWKYVQVPQYQPGLEPDRQPEYRPGRVWCGDNPKIGLYANTCTTTLDKLPNHFKDENTMIEEVRKTLEKNGDPIIPTTQELIKNGQWKDVGEKQPGICAGDNVPNMQYVVR
jgi:hypothetical protein